jgi:arylsulfatase A-like enzyme
MSVDRPNVLFVLADDLGWGDVSLHDSPIRTPNIDRLADTGIELERHYVNPTCTPTRASLLTGRFPGRFGVHATSPTNHPVLPDGYPTLASALRSCGYRTGLFGKWHLGSSPRYAPNAYGFDVSYGSLAGGVDPYNHHYKKGAYSVTWHRNGELVSENGHVTDLILQEATAWIEGQTEPWFCYVPFTAVHVPVKAPQSWLDRYAYGSYDREPLRDRSFKKYAAYASHMDAAVGRLIELLECRGRLEDTIVVFSSDNGALYDYPVEKTNQYPGWQEHTPRLGSNLPLRGQKGQLYEGGIRTPTFISWRGVLSHGRREHPMHMADWMPTLTGLAGYRPETDPRWDGVDMWPTIIAGKAREELRAIFWNVRGRRYGLCDGDWKLIADETMNRAACELYNLAADPRETHDVAGQNPDRVATLLAALSRQRELENSSRRADAPAKAEVL